jgi:hypothetical protein
MNARNPSICIGPNPSVSPEAGAPNALAQSRHAHKELERMIRRFADVFPGAAADAVSDADFCTDADIAAVARKQEGGDRPPASQRSPAAPALGCFDAGGWRIGSRGVRALAMRPAFRRAFRGGIVSPIPRNVEPDVHRVLSR